MFNNLADVRTMTEEWRIDYNTERPHKSLGYMSPIEYAELKRSKSALSTPASGNNLQIEAQPVVDKAVCRRNLKFENSN